MLFVQWAKRKIHSSAFLVQHMQNVTKRNRVTQRTEPTCNCHEEAWRNERPWVRQTIERTRSAIESISVQDTPRPSAEYIKTSNRGPWLSRRDSWPKWWRRKSGVTAWAWIWRADTTCEEAREITRAVMMDCHRLRNQKQRKSRFVEMWCHAVRPRWRL